MHDAMNDATTDIQIDQDVPSVDSKFESVVANDEQLPEPNGVDSIDIHIDESDARHEPIKEQPMSIDDASVVPQVGTPLEASSIPIDPPKGTPPPPTGELLADVKMAEEQSRTNGDVNGSDALMDTDTTPVTTPGMQAFSGMSNGASTSHTTPDDFSHEDLDEDKPPPAKRARVYSDADKASLAHSATPPPQSATTSNATTPVPPPASATSPQPPARQQSHPTTSTLSPAQHKFCVSTIRALKKQKDAAPFLLPVDPIALSIPHYPSIIKTPMDISTVERKLLSSNPSKPDPNLDNPRYFSADEFIADVRLIFSNSRTFNGPDHVVSLMGNKLEGVFDKQMKNVPPAAVEPKPIVKKAASPLPLPPVSAPAKKVPPARRPSTSVPVIRRTEAEGSITRPKREIHPPPPRDLPYADVPKKRGKPKRLRDDGTAEQLRFCGKILNDLHRKQHYPIANPFYEPVDWVAMDIPNYPRIVKKPMDLSTMRKKLEAGEYPNAEKFYEDFKLIIRNCFAFNPSGTPVNQAGIELQRLFDEKWKALPPLRSLSPRRVESEDESEEEDDSEDERARAIAEMESQIETMKASIAGLKSAKSSTKKPKKEKRERPAVASSSTPKAPKQPKAASTKPPGKPGRKPKKNLNGLVADDDVLSFDQKKELSEAIARLEGAKLERVIQIIHEGMPEIRDSNEEIELEIDLLPAPVLTKLYNFALRPLKTSASAANHGVSSKGKRTGKGTGTGGLKRKSMDEDAEAEKIRQLEERMALFENGGSGGALPPPANSGQGHADSDSSDSSGSDSSGSDSE